MARTRIVLVHGAWGSPGMWQWVIEELSDIAPLVDEIVAVDLPTMQRPDATLADDVATVVEAAGDGPVVLVGHSYGGAVVTEAGPLIPDLVHIVYVAAAMPDVGESMFDWFSKRPIEGGAPMELLEDGTGMILFEDDGSLDPLTSERLPNFEPRPFVLGAVMQPLERAGWVDTPTTYVVAARDTMIDPETQREMAARSGTVIEVDGDHLLNLGHPPALAAAIRSVVPT